VSFSRYVIILKDFKMETISVGTVTAATIITLWGIIQSFGLEYLWFVKDWFNALDTGKKKTTNFVGILIVTLVVYGLSFFGVIDAFSPDVAGALAAGAVILGALGIQQGVHQGTKRTTI
jgi:hypothetical protein